jgi:hypothetical protein
MIKLVLSTAILVAAIEPASAQYNSPPFRQSTGNSIADSRGYYGNGGGYGGGYNGGYGGTVIAAAPGAKVDYSQSLFGGTHLGIDKSCEKVSVGEVCKLATGKSILINRQTGAVTPLD